jgi:hypothetical protein
LNTQINTPEPKPLVMLWWNTSLSPLGESHATTADKAYVAAYLTELRRNLHVDIMALGEVSTDDINDIVAAIGDPHLSFHDATHMVSKCKFDIAILFDRRRLSLDDSSSILDSFGKTTLKVGERLRFISRESGEYLHLFVSHWPSRLHCHESDPKRTEIGTSLRKTLDAIRNSSTSQQYIILMGDYNDDPYSPSLSNHLLATRDRELARTNDSFLYNPFWRKLRESAPFVHGQSTKSICGTHYYSSGSHSRWFIFDQIMFSSAFLQDGPFLLNEERSMIIWNDDLELRLRSSKEIFDHLPVLAVIDIKEDV